MSTGVLIIFFNGTLIDILTCITSVIFFPVVSLFSAVLFASTQPDNFPRKLKKKVTTIDSDNIHYFCSATSE